MVTAQHLADFAERHIAHWRRIWMNSPAYVLSPVDAISERAYQYGGSVYGDFYNPGTLVDPTSDACIVLINAWATEGSDRAGLHDDYSDSIVRNVEANCSNTIVVMHNAGIRLVDTFVDHSDLTAIIYAHLPGQDTGRALAMILFGDVSPSGRLLYTVARNESDYGPLYNASVPEGKYDFSEGSFIDYRYFDKYRVAPRYEFGYGLSYTRFKYSNLQARLSGSISAYPAKTAVKPSGNPHLLDTVATASVTISNIGSYDSYEVAQLYLGIPG